jgi:branched-chain amino acid transport system substrate-binding protein
MPEAIKAWAGMVNGRGGLFGRPVQLIVVDDGSDPSRHVAALRDLVENRKVVAFVGNFAAITANAGRQYLEQVGVPVIGTSCALAVESQSPAFFDQCSPVDDIYINVARTAARFGPPSKKMAIFYCAEAEVCRYGDTVLAEKGGARKAGMEIVYRAQMSLVQPDYTAECINARNAGADVVFAILDPNGNARIAQSCARQGYRPQFVAAHNSPVEARTKTGLENILLAVPTFPFAGLNTPPAQEFVRVYSQTIGKAPGPVASMGWVSAKLFELAATRAAGAAKSISPRTLVDALHAMSGETLGGLAVPLTFPAGKGSVQPSCWWAMQGTPDGWKTLEGGKLLCP